MHKGAIFDMDGTLTLTEEFHHRAYAEIFKRFGVTFTFDEEITKYAGSGSKSIFTEVFKERGMSVSEEKIEKCIKEKKELYTKIVQETTIPLVSGVKEFLEKLEKAGIKRCIATGNSNLDVVRIILKKVGLDRFFSDIVSITEVPRGKPFPDVFLEAARRLQCEPAECIVFEDAINGVKAARAAGMQCIALETTTAREALIEAGASRVVKSYKEI